MPPPTQTQTHETIYHPYAKPTHPTKLPDLDTHEPSRKRQSRLRNIQRSLAADTSAAHPDPQAPNRRPLRLQADKRQEYERELVDRQREEAVRVAEKKRIGNMKRYKMVKFFESQKANRRLKKARKAVEGAETEEEKVRAKEALHIADVDRHYTQSSPYEWKYVGMYRQGGSAEDDARPAKGDADMWRRVEKAMENGTGGYCRVKGSWKSQERW
ncbi:hypothetical protein BT63DRAFT_414369 [Microthyrium microscopicum]|uniref:rRNA-processing protein EFG1 n=1 Tax=Microthyrium microscopicum TaxID=703497 RepID=A0A6A6U7W9_9PEZI|nr:hypothetical protein BT63DRAFT_414369 [Microthyrium microscopicum]